MKKVRNVKGKLTCAVLLCTIILCTSCSISTPKVSESRIISDPATAATSSNDADATISSSESAANIPSEKSTEVYTFESNGSQAILSLLKDGTFVMVEPLPEGSLSGHFYGTFTQQENELLLTIAKTDLASNLAGYNLRKIFFEVESDNNLLLKTSLCMTTEESVFVRSQ